MVSPRTIFMYPKKKYGPHEIDALEYAKRYGEHMIAVRIKNWRSGKGTQDSFINLLMDLVQHNQDALINTKTE